MSDPVYIPLKDEGKTPASSARGWQKPGYKGVKPEGRVARRTDGLVVVDCDSDEAASSWRDITGNAPDTLTVSTPRGWHFYYTAGPGDPTGPAVGVLDGIDIRAGAKSYVICPPTPGYAIVGRRRKPQPFQQRWLPKRSQPEVLSEAVDEWDMVPEGQRNATLTAFAGTFRRQGMEAGTMYQLLLGINEGLCDPPLPADEVEVIARSIGRHVPDPDFSVDLVTQVEATVSSEEGLWQWLSTMTLPPPPQWWWQPYIPKGRLVLLDGSEGIGKGLFCAHLATLIADEAKVLWLATEDDPEEDIQRRMMASGWSPKTHADIGFPRVDPRFPTHTDEIAEEIERLGAGVMIMDPGRSYLVPPEGSKGMSYNDEAHIRPGLEAINRMAKATGCTVLFVHHWNKNTQATVQYRQGGSGAFSQVVRHRVTLAWYGPTIGGEGAFEVSKSNIAPKGAVHGYEVTPVTQLDTAAIALTERLEEFDRLDDWLRHMESTNEKGIEIDSKPTLETVVGRHALGSPLPSVAELAEQTGMSKRDIANVIDELVDEGVIRRGPKRQLFRVGEGER